VLNYIIYALIGVGILILLVCLSIASFAGSNMVENYEKADQDLSSSFTVASALATMISKIYVDYKVQVGHSEGYLTDAYRPSRRVVFLSDKVFGSSSVAALAITAHELGHALQDKNNPGILRRKDNLSLASKILGFFMLPFFVAGIILFIVNAANLIPVLVCLGSGIAIFFLALIVKGLTISIERDASKNAITFLRDLNILDDDEIREAKKLLQAALLTYIADFLRAILGWTFLTPKTKLFG